MLFGGVSGLVFAHGVRASRHRALSAMTAAISGAGRAIGRRLTFVPTIPR